MFYNGVTLLEDALKQGIIPELEKIENPISVSNGNSVVRIVFPEFTCVCPKTGYPDFGSIELYYLPNEHIVELKSWKLFLNSFRMVGTFHETVTNHIFNTVTEVLKPKWAMVCGDFFPRGNVDTTIVIETETPRPAAANTIIVGNTPHSRSFHG